MSAAHRHGTPECRETFARLSEYLDQELDAAICRELEGHLRDCPPCRAFLDSLERAVALIREERRAGLPEDLRRELLESYRRVREGRSGP